MGWKDLLQVGDETVVSPWVGETRLRTCDRVLRLKGRRPVEYGWHRFTIQGRDAYWKEVAEACPEDFQETARGYLVGDLFVPEQIVPIISKLSRVYLIEPGLDRFSRVFVGRTYEDGPWIYGGPEMPLGPEDEVLQAFLAEAPNVNGIAGVPPALDVAFRVETSRRVEAERRRREEQARREREELRKRMSTAQGRRELAKEDFGAAAREALSVGGATYLDHRASPNSEEMVVRFRLNNRQFECTCNLQLRIIDSGICLKAEDEEDGFEEGTRGDTWLTLESLPATIQQATREGRLVIFRHA
jgi:hypothetical protein